MSSNVLLIGPSRGGKTTMIYSYQGKEAPEGATGQKGEHTHPGFWFFGSEITEIGGVAQHYEKVLEEISKCLKKERKVLFVFNGVQFLEQADNPEKGGEIWATWLYYCAKTEIEKCEVHFIATHDDEVNGLSELIRNRVREVNEQYSNLGCGVGMRYDASRFEAPYFHCINALDHDVVKELLDKIRK